MEKNCKCKNTGELLDLGDEKIVAELFIKGKRNQYTY